jgi:hypothetical protein
MKRALGPRLIALPVAGIPRISLAAVTCGALDEDGHTARSRSFVMTSDALGASLSLVRKLAIRIQVSLVMPVAEQNDAARSFQIKLDNTRRRVIRPDSVAIALLIDLERWSQEWSSRQSCGHRNRVQS